MSLIEFEHQRISLGPGESVLEGLLRSGAVVKWSCRAGSCQCCMLRARRGHPPEAAQRGLDPALRAKAYFLPCKAFPALDLVVERPDPEDLQHQALVVEKHGLSEDICRIRLEVSDQFRPRPGQFVRVVHPDGSTRPYSVASRPEHDWFVDLHVRRVPGGRVSAWLCDAVGTGDVITLQPPAGALINRNPPPGQKLLLLATGTGLAPMLAILHEALEHSDPDLLVWLLHGGRTRADLYAHEELSALALQDPRLHYRPWLSRGPVEAGIGFGRITAGLKESLPSLADFRVFVAGHPEMVAEASAACLALGVSEAALFSEAFEFDSGPARQASTVVPTSPERRVPDPDPELWARLDNGRVLREVLRDFYQLAFADERLGPYFAGVTQQRLREKQYSFLRSLMLGTRDYFGQRPRNAHHWMVISDDLFDYRLGLMSQCMRDHGVIEPWMQRWHVFEEFFRQEIVKAEPIPRLIDGEPIQLDGVEDVTVEEGCLCDGCGGEVAAGSEVRFHLRLSTIYCHRCRGLADRMPLAPGA